MLLFTHTYPKIANYPKNEYVALKGFNITLILYVKLNSIPVEQLSI
jgi:hypothetical protein